MDWYQIAGSLLVMAGVYSLLTIAGFILMGRAALKDPEWPPAGPASA